MISTVTKASDWSLYQVQESLLPVKGNIIYRAACYAYQVFKFGVFAPLSVGTTLLDLTLKYLFSYTPPRDSNLVRFAKHPIWHAAPEKAPVPIGFASADFQENGPAGHQDTNWAKHYEENPDLLPAGSKVPDIWNHPEKVIERLKALGCTKYRLSISRDKIDPDNGGLYKEFAVTRYQNFCSELIKNGIEPMVTLHHFSDPTYFSWQNDDNIDGFVNFAVYMSEILYKAGVRKIVTINEPTVVAFQGWVMGEFPPNKTLDFEGAGKVLENMMRAHTLIYQRVKEDHPEMQIGLAHDPIRFRHFHKAHPLWTPVEKILCHYLTEVNHSALMRFFQTGKFSLKVPFRANYQFEMGAPPPLDFIGIQYYTDPLLKVDFSGGRSVTRVRGEKLTSYDYRMYPQGLASALHEFNQLGVPIDITEIGLDTGVNKSDHDDSVRIQYFERIFQVVRRALEEGINVRSLHFWTLIDNLEWYKGFKVRFGLNAFDERTGEIRKRELYHWVKTKIAGGIPAHRRAQEEFKDVG